MSHSLNRLSKSILEQPQLITQARFEEIAAVLDNREDYSKLVEAAQLANDKQDGKVSQEDLAETSVGVLRIEGALTNKPTMFGALCGLTSYQELLSQTDELCANAEVNTIMMLVDSGGGDAYNLFSTARNIKAKCVDNNKKLIAYVDGSSGSAAFGLTAVADEVIMHPDAQVGSIGVVVRLVNDSKAQELSGLKTTYITAGASKVPFDESGEFREEFKSDIQDKVDELYTGFINHVVTYRNMSSEAVKGTEAKMFSANKAMELGLVDKVMENEEFYEYLADFSYQEKEEKAQTDNIIKVESSKEQPITMSIEDNLMSDTEKKVEAPSVDTEMLAKLQETLDKQSAQLLAYQAKDDALAKAALESSLDKFDFLAESKGQVVSFLSCSEVSLEHKALMNSVMTSAFASSELIKEEAATNIADAQLATEAAQAEKETIKEEFGTKETASTEVPEKALSVTETLTAKVAMKKAAKLAAKA